MSAADPSPVKARKPKLKHPTWEYPKGSGIKIAEMPNKTAGQAYGVSYQVRIPAELLGVPGKRELLQKRTKAEAERLAEERFLALKKHGTEFSKIPAHAQRQAAIAWGMLDEHNQKTRLSLEFIDVVKAGMRVLSPTGGLRTFAEVAGELRASKRARLDEGSYDIQTERNFRQRSLRLEETGLGPKLVSQLVGSDVEHALTALRGLEGQRLSSRSILNYRRILSEIFSHAVKKQYTPTNPLDQLGREDLKRLGGEKQKSNHDQIKILKPDQVRRLLNSALELGELGMLASLALRLFCGLRTGEAARLDWSNVRWLDSRPVILLAGWQAKKRVPREITIPKNALAWLKLCNPPSSGPVQPGSEKTYAKRFGRIPQHAGVAWDMNCTRHSYGSYHYALHDNAALTSKELGHINNPHQLFTSYRRLATKEDAEAYFSIAPAQNTDVVTVFPQAASAS